MSNDTLLITLAKPSPDHADIFSRYVEASTRLALDAGATVSSRFGVRHIHGDAPAVIFGLATFPSTESAVDMFAAPAYQAHADLVAYQQIAGPLAAKYQAAPVAQLPVVGHPVGETPASFVAVSRFPSADAVDTFFTDPDYLAVVDVRDRAFRSLNLYVSTR